jgi:hypothetical protein
MTDVAGNVPVWLANLPQTRHDEPEGGFADPQASRAVLSRIVFLRFAGVRDRQPQVAEFQAQGLPGDPQYEGRLLLIPCVKSRTRASNMRSSCRCNSP